MKQDTSYELLAKQAEELIADNKFFISALSNISALLNQALEEVNWVGFYLRKEDTLYLGPFQGEVACVEIPKDRGVCGSALTRSETILVKNVHDFPGHIACDSTTNSEIVVPIKFAGEVVAVLDLDSREFERFEMEDQKGLEKVVKVIEKHWKSIF